MSRFIGDTSSRKVEVNQNGTSIGTLSISGNNASRIFALPAEVQVEKHDMIPRNDQTDQMGGAWLIMDATKLNYALLKYNFEDGIPKSLTLSYPGKLSATGAVEIQYKIVLLSRDKIHDPFGTYLSGYVSSARSIGICTKIKVYGPAYLLKVSQNDTDRIIRLLH